MKSNVSPNQYYAKCFWWIKQEVYCVGKVDSLKWLVFFGLLSLVCEDVLIKWVIVWIVKFCQGTTQKVSTLKVTFFWPTQKLVVFFCIFFADTPFSCCRFLLLTWGIPLLSPQVTSFLNGHNIVRFVNYYCLNNTVMLHLNRSFPNLMLFQILLFRFCLRKFVNELVIYPQKKESL